MRYKKIADTLWTDKKTGQVFGYDQYIGSKHGKNFHFCCDQDSFLKGSDHGLKYFNNFFKRIGIEKETFKNSEIILTKPQYNFKDKTILVVGGGPSTGILNWQNLQYDEIFTCNKFYKNNKIAKQHPNLVTFSADTNLQDVKLNEYLNKFRPHIFFEAGFEKDFEEVCLKKFLKTYQNNSSYYWTRYRSVLGITSRQIIYCILSGAKRVYVVGLDQYVDGMKTHSFEENKARPRWRVQYGKDFQDQQNIVFWDYVCRVAKINNCEIYNLAEDCACNSLSFITKQVTPLTKEIKNRIY